MSDKLDDVLKRLEERQKTIIDERIRNVLADDLESAYMFAARHSRYVGELK